jgi:hypothetical protein
VVYRVMRNDLKASLCSVAGYPEPNLNGQRFRFFNQLRPVHPEWQREHVRIVLVPPQPTINHPPRQIVRREGPSEPRQEADSGEYLSVLA